MKTEQEKKEERYLISETAKLVGVESHVLRYWEEELKLPIRRNELGHRYYTREDVEQFQEIRKLKEQGLQLKAIRTVLTSEGSMQILMPAREPVGTPDPVRTEEKSLEAGEKAIRLQMLLHGLISQAVRENNEKLAKDIRETVAKEMDYQFRVREEEEQNRERIRMEKEEEHFRKLDEALRQYAGRKAGRGMAGGEKHTGSSRNSRKCGGRKKNRRRRKKSSKKKNRGLRAGQPPQAGERRRDPEGKAKDSCGNRSGWRKEKRNDSRRAVISFRHQQMPPLCLCRSPAAAL